MLESAGVKGRGFIWPAQLLGTDRVQVRVTDVSLTRHAVTDVRRRSLAVIRTLTRECQHSADRSRQLQMHV
jgi:hypothetical protein